MESGASDGKTGPILDPYPGWMVLLANALGLGIYALGGALVARLGWGFLAAYLVFLAGLEIRQLARGCVHCAYYGKACFSGKGVLASWLFKRGDPAKFSSREATWLTLAPDMLVVLIPLGIGLVLSVRRFEWLLLALMAGLVLLAFPGNGLVRGKLACCHCRQRGLGCPAEKLFRRPEPSDPTRAA